MSGGIVCGQIFGVKCLGELPRGYLGNFGSIRQSTAKLFVIEKIFPVVFGEGQFHPGHFSVLDGLIYTKFGYRRL